MLTALWNLSAAIRGYLRFYMPTNRAVDWLRTSGGLKWAIPIALVATPAYLGLTALAIQGAGRPGLGWLNVLVFLFFWNAGQVRLDGRPELPAAARPGTGRVVSACVNGQFLVAAGGQVEVPTPRRILRWS